MTTISTMRTGHHRLADGSLLRVDIELGRWVGSLYTRDMRVKTRVVGSDVEVRAWADGVVDRPAFKARTGRGPNDCPGNKADSSHG